MHPKAYPYISVIGDKLFQPILDLMEKLSLIRFGRPNEVQTSPAENGHAVAVVLLAVVMLESIVGRVRVLRAETEPRSSVDSYLNGLICDEALKSQVAELFVLRDVIAHNHIWSGQVYDDGDLRFDENPELLNGYGDRKFRYAQDESSRTTKCLGLNLVPTRIWRGDSLIVLHVVSEVLQRLKNLNPSYYNDFKQFSYKGEWVSVISGFSVLEEEFRTLSTPQS